METHTHTQHWMEMRGEKEKKSKSISGQWSEDRCALAGHRPRGWLLQGKWACRTSGKNKQCLPTPGSPLLAAIFGARSCSNGQCLRLSHPTDWQQGRGYSSTHNWEQERRHTSSNSYQHLPSRDEVVEHHSRWVQLPGQLQWKGKPHKAVSYLYS